MLDIKFIRENPDLIKEAVRKKRGNFNVGDLLDVDVKRRAILTELEDLRAKQNKSSDGVARAGSDAERQAMIEMLRESKAGLAAREEEFAKLDAKWQELMLLVPNVPDPSVPDGETDADNVETKVWGELPQFDFPIKDHMALMRDLDLVDFDRGTKVAGFRGYFLKNEGALLSMALWQFTLDQLRLKGFTPFLAPSLVREENFVGTGYLPHGKDELYATQDNLYLAGTSEVPMMGLYRDEVLDEKTLPLKYASFSPCYRREAGSYGKDAKGLYRVHEFMKVEQIVMCHADHQESVEWHEEITKNSEDIVQALKLPYRVVTNCGGDLGQGQVKKYDIEVWVPSEKHYRESHSASYFHDFQTRRLNIRYKDTEGKMRFVHSLNNTVIATPRILISILENYQQSDGTILVPDVLQRYIGKNIIRRD
jgi:seryl-tRNA synthetase